MSEKDILNKENYSYVTRSLIRLFNNGRLTNVSDITVESNYGYVTQIRYKDGSCRITYGNDLGINSGSSGDLTKDKGYTKFMLRNLKVNCPNGGEFLLPWWADTIRKSQEKHGNNNIKTIDQIAAYIQENLTYPIYVKPVNGSKGTDIYKVQNNEELDEIIAIYNEKRVRVVIIEENIAMPDYRIVILDGKLISAYKRIPLKVKGNGKNSIEKLIIDLQKQYQLEGRDTLLNPNDTRIIQYLRDIGLNLDYIPSLAEIVTLLPISNLSAGGTSADITDKIHPKWVKLAKYIAKNFNLRLCGIDIACNDITSTNSRYSVLEVNSSPGLDHYASSGEKQKKIVDDLYVKVFNAMNPF
ncbi:hypothetical protein M1145_03265 [Patescibacteria group bacterium]|nr:hypothetical protein [Patescibacteria group bacterium]